MGVAVLLLVWAGWHVQGRLKAANVYVRDQRVALAELIAIEAQAQHGRSDVKTAATPSPAWQQPVEQTTAAPQQPQQAASGEDDVYEV